MSSNDTLPRVAAGLGLVLAHTGGCIFFVDEAGSGGGGASTSRTATSAGGAGGAGANEPAGGGGVGGGGEPCSVDVATFATLTDLGGATGTHRVADLTTDGTRVAAMVGPAGSVGGPYTISDRATLSSPWTLVVQNTPTDERRIAIFPGSTSPRLLSVGVGSVCSYALFDDTASCGLFSGVTWPQAVPLRIAVAPGGRAAIAYDAATHNQLDLSASSTSPTLRVHEFASTDVAVIDEERYAVNVGPNVWSCGFQSGDPQGAFGCLDQRTALDQGLRSLSARRLGDGVELVAGIVDSTGSLPNDSVVVAFPTAPGPIYDSVPMPQGAFPNALVATKEALVVSHHDGSGSQPGLRVVCPFDDTQRGWGSRTHDDFAALRPYHELIRIDDTHVLGRANDQVDLLTITPRR